MQDAAHDSTGARVKALHDPMREIAALFLESGKTPAEFAKALSVNHGLIYKLEQEVKRGGLHWSGKLAGTGWQTLTLAFRTEGEALYPHYVVSVFPPRKCDVTDEWFIPSDSRQRFAPGLSEAVKRAARRDLARARRLYATRGDWGRKGQA